MVHKPLPDIRKYALITNQHSEFYAVVKPAGLDVFINNGKIYDFNYNELENTYLPFHFEKLLQSTVNLKLTAVGVLTEATGSDSILRYRSSLYQKTRSSSVFSNLQFIIYDAVFPTFNDDHIYKWRYSIAEKVVGVLPNCKVASRTPIKDETELQRFVNNVFSIDISSQVLVYKIDEKFVPGESQLYYDENDTVSYVVTANQRYRGHIKKVIPTTHVFSNENKVELANRIVAKFKQEYVDIPIDPKNIALRRYIWENRKELKNYPFWFTGYTFYEDEKYVTVINEFKSFITP